MQRAESTSQTGAHRAPGTSEWLHRLSGLYTACPKETLPFTVRVVQNANDLDKAVSIRHAAYARHLPEFSALLRQPETADLAPGTVILLAESKLDGSPLGTMRIQTNRVQPLMLQQSVDLPEWLTSHGMAEATRLGVTEKQPGRLVKTVLYKAYYLYCVLNHLRYMVIAGRSPIDRQYERLLFKDVNPEQRTVPLRHALNLPHRIMYFDAFNARQLWADAQHPLFDFVFRTEHPDLDLSGHHWAM
jgi:hypothetical protein